VLANWATGGNHNPKIDEFSIIPEPAIMNLLILGCAGLLVRRNRR